MSLPRVGQAVVTDPLEKGGGYVLVAASRAVEPDDAQYLVDFPAAGDALHVEETPGKYYSFLRLPSGRFALTKRFAQGKRRVSFQRIVVHTLVVSEDVLDALAFEPWFLVAEPCLRKTGGSGSLRLSDLESDVGDRSLKFLPDLQVIPPSDPYSFRKTHWSGNRNHLLDSCVWGEDRLARELARWLDALASGNGVLEAFDRQAEVLLHLVWSLLPIQERKSISWTTHLPPGVPGFHLALAPAEAIASGRLSGPLPWAWPSRNENSAAQRGDSKLRALADWLATSKDPLSRLDEGYRTHRIGITEGRADQMLLWLASINGGREAFEGATDPESFERGLERLAFDSATFGSVTDDLVLKVAVRAAEGSSERAGAVFRSLEKHKPASRIIKSYLVSGLAENPAISADQLLAAGELARQAKVDSLPTYIALFDGVERRSENALPPSDKAGWVDLALSVGRHDAERSGKCAERLLSLAGGLDHALAHLAINTKTEDRFFAKALFQCAVSRQEGGHIARLAEHLIDAWLGATPEDQEQLALAPAWLKGLWSFAPEKLPKVLRAMPARGVEIALKILPAWLEEDPGRLSKLLTPDVMNHLAKPCKEVVRLAKRVAAANLGQEIWALFLIAEVEALDRKKGDATSLREMIAFMEGTKGPRDLVALGLIEHFESQNVVLGEAHREIASRVAPELAQMAPRVVQALRRIEPLEAQLFLAWAPAVSAVAHELARSSKETLTAAQVAADWWVALASKFPSELPPNLSQEALDLVRSLTDSTEARRVLESWQSRFETLAKQEHPLLEVFEGIAPSDLRKLIERVGRQARVRRGDLVVLVAEVAALGPMSREEAGTEIAPLLPPDTSKRLQALGVLLGSPKILPSTRRWLEDSELESTLRSLGSQVAAVDLPVEAFDSGLFLTAVAHQVGKVHPGSAMRLLVMLTEKKLFWEVGALLAGADREARSLMESLQHEKPNLFEGLAHAPGLSYLHLIPSIP